MSERTQAPPRRWGRTGGQVALTVLLVLVTVLLVGLFAQRHGFFDLNVYYGAINYWAHGGEIYDYIRPRSTYGFTYPPFAAVAMSPMAVLPWPVVIVVSLAGTVAVTVWLLRTLLAPTVARLGWTPWFALAVALCLAAFFEPMRETVFFGQVNMLLLGLVAADLLLLVTRGSRWAGVGIGLATAIKLTPGVFIVYLLITRRWRAAATAAGTAAVATLAAAAIAPDATREFWTAALWDTNRVGVLSFISNQSLQGVVARLNPAHPSRLLWVLLVLGALAVWSVRSRRAAKAGDEPAGLALTGVVGLLLSPVTWVHHLVWLIPALVLVVERAFTATGRRRAWLLGFGAAVYAVLSSRLVWLWEDSDFAGVAAALGSNAYVWACVALLLFTPLDTGPAVGPVSHAPDRVPGHEGSDDGRALDLAGSAHGTGRPGLRRP